LKKYNLSTKLSHGPNYPMLPARLFILSRKNKVLLMPKCFLSLQRISWYGLCSLDTFKHSGTEKSEIDSRLPEQQMIKVRNGKMTFFDYYHKT
jgi:hypothetical protein